MPEGDRGGPAVVEAGAAVALRVAGRVERRYESRTKPRYEGVSFLFFERNGRSSAFQLR